MKLRWSVCLLILLAQHSNAQTVNYAEALQKSLYFYDAQKSGAGITGGRLAWRGDSECVDMMLPLNSDMTNMSAEFITANRAVLDPDGNGMVDVSGGYHDAGGHIKFGLPQTFASATLGWALFEFKDAFVRVHEYRHMLDLLKWFSDYYLRCTFTNSVGDVIAFCYQVGEGNIDHKYWGPPETADYKKFKRPAYFATVQSPASDQTAGAAASLAISYLIHLEEDPAYAVKCLETAVALYTFSVKNRGLGYSGGFYNSAYDEDELAWAAIWLRIATGEDHYLDDIIKIDSAGQYTGWLKKIIESKTDSWQNTWGHCWDMKWSGVFAKLAPLTNDPRFWDMFRWNLEFWSGIRQTTNKDDTFVPTTPAGFSYLSTWGSARYNAAAQFQGMLYKKYTDTLTFDAWMTHQMSYILGNNPMRRSYVVGYGDSYASRPHHRAAHGSAVNNMFDPPRHKHILWGALVGGPGPDDEHIDKINGVIYNEVALDYNAGLVAALAGHMFYFGQDHKPLADFPPRPPEMITYRAEAKIERETNRRSQLSLRVKNESAFPPRNDVEMTVRYFFNISELYEHRQTISDVAFKTYYEPQAENGTPITIAGPLAWDAVNGIYYLEFTWPGGFYGLREYQFGLLTAHDAAYRMHWNPANDHSHLGLTKRYSAGKNLVLYIDKKRYSGIEPERADAPPGGIANKGDSSLPVAEKISPAKTGALPYDVAYTIADQWETGFRATIEITNRSEKPLSGFSLTWEFPDGQRICQGWKARLSQQGKMVRAVGGVSDLQKKIIPANGGKIIFGFQGTYTGENSIPIAFAFDGKVKTDDISPAPETSLPPDTGKLEASDGAAVVSASVLHRDAE